MISSSEISWQKGLERFGFEVKTVSDGYEALSLYEAAMSTDRPFDAVVMDLTVRGGMGGRKTMEKLLKLDPNVKAIVSSGYSNDPVMAEHRKYGFGGRVAKPFRIAELSAAVKRILETKGTV